MGAFRYLIVGRHDCGRGVPWNSRPRHGRRGSGSSATSRSPVCTPPLSKALWKGKEESSVWRGTEELGVELVLGRRVTSLDLDAHTATDDTGEAHSYERLLLATGGTPRRVDAWDDGVVYYRTLQTYRQLRGRGRRRPRNRDRRLHRLGGRCRPCDERLCRRSSSPTRASVRASSRPSSRASSATTARRAWTPGRTEGRVDLTRRRVVRRRDGERRGRGRRRRRGPRDPAANRPRRAGRARGRRRPRRRPRPRRRSRGRLRRGRCRPLPRRGARRDTPSSTRTTRTPTGATSARTWPAPTPPTTTSFFYRTSSISATRRWATSTRGWTPPSRSGSSPTARASSLPSRTGSRADSCSGTCGPGRRGA